MTSEYITGSHMIYMHASWKRDSANRMFAWADQSEQAGYTGGGALKRRELKKRFRQRPGCAETESDVFFEC